ncbi:hypothetical protein DESPIG_01700 [Desulfovibrio piger ATCC 29098]|uniref:Uncharacterized protein n=1 Tax=Desulfovibrio piger ATCC 29098 TaxID=411464 RepID=B6WUE2_9BACT|nr:hypothetical protein DESPIG_01700 [Desulfovibrio piger ATCC 29098]
MARVRLAREMPGAFREMPAVRWRPAEGDVPAGWGLRFGRLQKVDDRTVVQIRELLQAFQADRVVAFFHAADGLGFQSQQMGRFFLGEACLLAPQLQVMGCDHDDVFGHVVFL